VSVKTEGFDMNLPIPVVNRVLIPNMEMRNYLCEEGLSSSALSKLDQSPKHYHSYMNGEMSFESRAMNKGTGTHLILEDIDRFRREYMRKPDGMDRRSKAGKEWFAEVESSGMKILDKVDYDQVLQMYSAVHESTDPVVRELMQSPHKDEISIFWTEKEIPMKARADRLIQPSEAAIEAMQERWPNLIDVPFGISVVMDFKTCQSAAPEAWHGRWGTINKFNYALKAAHYLAGFQADLFIWLAIESAAPFNVVPYVIGKRRTQEMMERRLQLLALLKECQARNEWPGYSINGDNTCID
jgi:hypothetical protein